MGKWKEVARDLPRVQVTEDGFQGKVNDAKAAYNQRAPGVLVGQYKAARKVKDRLKAELDALNVQLAALEQLTWDALEDAGLEAVKIEGGGSFGVTDDVTVALEDRGAFIEWLKENDLDNLLTVHAGTVSTLVKERIEGRQELPPGVRVGAYKKTVFRRR